MKAAKCEQVAQLTDSGFTEMTGRVYSQQGLSPSIRTFAGGNTEVKIMEEPIIYDDYNGRIKADQSVIRTLTTNCGNDAERNGVKIIEPIALDEQNDIIRKDGTVGTLTTDGSSPKHNNRVIEPNCRVRKLTPKECFRLMGVKDEDYEKVAVNQSNSSLYHLAGDSLVTILFAALIAQMVDNGEEKYNKCVHDFYLQISK